MTGPINFDGLKFQRETVEFRELRTRLQAAVRAIEPPPDLEPKVRLLLALAVAGFETRDHVSHVISNLPAREKTQIASAVSPVVKVLLVKDREWTRYRFVSAIPHTSGITGDSPVTHAPLLRKNTHHQVP
jgi:hypothetical protein